MSRSRCVEAELLDQLPPGDLAAAGSRRDLRRLNFCMGHSGLVARQLREAFPTHHARTIADLGGGDGSFLLSVARRLQPAWQGVEALIVDRQDLVDVKTRDDFQAAGWTVKVIKHDLLDFFSKHSAPPQEAIIANLVLHHFHEPELRQLLPGIAQSTSLFLATEPRRSAASLAVSRLVGLIGCNAVTRHDAPASVRAGFCGNELSELWPEGNWAIEERRAGFFSHLFTARRLLS